MRPIGEYSPMDRESFEREIAPKGEPAVLRGLVADCFEARGFLAGEPPDLVALVEKAVD